VWGKALKRRELGAQPPNTIPGWVGGKKKIDKQQQPFCYNSIKMTIRLILAIVSTLLEEAALAVIVLWGLPQLGIEIPLAGLIAMMVVWGAYAVITYRISSRALGKKPEVGLPDMVGSKGEVVSLLEPEGLVRIKGELWIAKSARGRIDTGEEVTVAGQDGLKLVVRRNEPGDKRD